MKNRKPVAPATTERYFDPHARVSGNFLDHAYDPDDNQINLAFVNGQRIDRKVDAYGDMKPTLIKGQYGILEIFAFGGYSYKLYDAVANSLKAGDTVTESFAYKIVDSHGATDFDRFKIQYEVPTVGHYTIDFEDVGKGPDIKRGYKGFEFGSHQDGGPWWLESEGGNHFAHGDPFDTFFERVDGKKFKVLDMLVATSYDPGEPGYDAEVTFTGWSGNHVAGTKHVTITADTIDDQQHLSLSSFGYVDTVTYSINTTHGDPSGYTMLVFDNIEVIV